MACKSCGKTNVPFHYSTYNVNPDTHYVDMATFEQPANEIAEIAVIKKYLSDFNNINVTQSNTVKESDYKYYN